ncbi:hypothetical protein [Sandaracinobacteroides saxicola]|uniref:Uncharacterized protein n=1 Tax=Sandaracinobacteroides saxicola TaxID=2759707 RepID=A0A7G5IIC2_9SPHN|nr:hypothetical protein [Sandaracinobacteroides saxicola]QMW23114.1 hypothetical protein H3309_00930 [Sandaracinobacteroides saxicola]
MLTPLTTLLTSPQVAPHLPRALIVRAARQWVLIARAGRNPRPALATLLGPRGAAAFACLMESLVVAWPDPFTTYPPCATTESPDERTLLTLLTLAGDDPAFHTHLADLLPAADRTRLHRLATRTTAELTTRFA